MNKTTVLLILRARENVSRIRLIVLIWNPATHINPPLCPCEQYIVPHWYCHAFFAVQRDSYYTVDWHQFLEWKMGRSVEQHYSEIISFCNYLCTRPVSYIILQLKHRELMREQHPHCPAHLYSQASYLLIINPIHNSSRACLRRSIQFL